MPFGKPRGVAHECFYQSPDSLSVFSRNIFYAPDLDSESKVSVKGEGGSGQVFRYKLVTKGVDPSRNIPKIIAVKIFKEKVGIPYLQREAEYTARNLMWSALNSAQFESAHSEQKAVLVQPFVEGE